MNKIRKILIFGLVVIFLSIGGCAGPSYEIDSEEKKRKDKQGVILSPGQDEDDMHRLD